MLDKKRKMEIFRGIARHVLALVYLVAELCLGYKPDSLTKGDN